MPADQASWCEIFRICLPGACRTNWSARCSHLLPRDPWQRISNIAIRSGPRVRRRPRTSPRGSAESDRSTRLAFRVCPRIADGDAEPSDRWPRPRRFWSGSVLAVIEPHTRRAAYHHCALALETATGGVRKLTVASWPPPLNAALRPQTCALIDRTVLRVISSVSFARSHRSFAW